MSQVAQRIETVRATLPAHVELVAVSKYHSAERIAEAYAAGQRIFGESRAQELLAKREVLPADIHWHFIGHLQPNKVKYIAPFVTLIHAVDSEKLLREIDRQAARFGRTIDCLLQLHVAQEESKYGFTPAEAESLLESGTWRQLPHVRLRGIMCMASNTDDMKRIRADFRTARDFFLMARSRWFAGDDAFAICSWGMTHDYPVAIEEGSTMVRVGSGIFGENEH